MDDYLECHTGVLVDAREIPPTIANPKILCLQLFGKTVLDYEIHRSYF
jgi:hypothetical protein